MGGVRIPATNLVPNDTNGVLDVFVHDSVTGATTRVSVVSLPVGYEEDEQLRFL